jgi:hypothetical protein
MGWRLCQLNESRKVLDRDAHTGVFQPRRLLTHEKGAMSWVISRQVIRWSPDPTIRWEHAINRFAKCFNPFPISNKDLRMHPCLSVRSHR